VPEEVFLKYQRRSKDKATVKSIYNKLCKKAKKVLKAYLHKSLQQRSMSEITNLIQLSIGPSKWLESTLKMALLTGYKIEQDPIFSSLLYTMQLSAFINLKKKARIMV